MMLSFDVLTKVLGLGLQPVLRSCQLRHRALEFLPSQYLLADVADHGNGALLSVRRTDANFNGKFVTVAALGEHFPPESHGANAGVDGEFRAQLGMPLAVSLREECLDLDTDELAGLVAEEALGVLVCEHDRTVTARDEQSVRNGLVRGVGLGSHSHCVTPLFCSCSRIPATIQGTVREFTPSGVSAAEISHPGQGRGESITEKSIVNPMLERLADAGDFGMDFANPAQGASQFRIPLRKGPTA